MGDHNSLLAMDTSHIDGPGDLLRQPGDGGTQLTEYMRESLLRAATEIVNAVATLPDELVDRHLTALDTSNEFDAAALTRHLTAAEKALSVTRAALQTTAPVELGRGAT